VDLHLLPLDIHQGFLLSRLDGIAGLEDLGSLTGLAPDQVQAMLDDLVAMGAVLPDPEAPAPPVPEAAEASAPDSDLSRRALFEQQLQQRPAEARAALAREAAEPELEAYCFDPMPQVIRELLQNRRAGLRHARLVAAHHHTTAGLEHLAANAAFANDPGVRRALLQNPVLPASLFQRLWSPRRLQEQFQVACSHDVPEQTRAMAREALQAGFSRRNAEEKAELILKTEGRCLLMLGSVTVDGHTTELLCRHTYVSTLLIQNIARWSAAPPKLLAHLLRQEMVRRNAQLRIILERHPNAKG
jgi:hypothetical protein